MSRRIFRDRMDRAANYTPRPFNAQVYDVPSEEYCRVLVQGSVNPVVAWFTRSGRNVSDEVKIGNAVLCQYKLGNRGRIEVLGNGTILPSLIEGSSTPVPPVGRDAVLSGCRVLAVPSFN